MSKLKSVKSAKSFVSSIARSLLRFYDSVILQKPWWVLCTGALLLIILAQGVKKFHLDASADSLILEHDPDLRLLRQVTERYGTAEFLLIAYVPNQDLLADATIASLAELQDELEDMERVKTINSIVNVPLLRNPPVPLKNLRKNIKTLLSEDVDKDLARQELQENPVFKNLLVSPDLQTTALVVTFEANEVVEKLLKKRLELLEQSRYQALTKDQQQLLDEITTNYHRQRTVQNQLRHQDIATIRSIVNKHRDSGQFYIGGVPMIADDMMTFIKNDLRFFGVGMFLFLIITLGAIFRRLRWILLPILCCAISVYVMIGLLGYLDLEVTVISSNFISLQLIMTMALAIHIIVRFMEVSERHPNRNQHSIMLKTVSTIFVPCLYTTATTAAGFSSLVFCDILPVINFGRMMTAGLLVSLLTTFIVLPVAIILLPPGQHVKRCYFGNFFTTALSRFTQKQGYIITAISSGAVLLILIGVAQLEVENSFINYFRPSTEIYKGLAFIDQHLGGTTPLELLIEFPDEKRTATTATAELDEEDIFDDFEEFEVPPEQDKYWFTPARLESIGAVHRYLESLPETGKIFSVYTVIELAQWLTGNADFDALDMALLFNQLPEEFQDFILQPYASIEHNQARVSARIKDSQPSLRRSQFLQDVRADLDDKLAGQQQSYQIAGMMVLYNNMLQSLFKSQIETIGITLLAIFMMFLALFRSWKISLIAIFPNLIACLSILGVMGLAGVPLDMMTITIVAISIGIAVDNTIHYIHRFQREYEVDHDYEAAMQRSHATIGHALFYTSFTIVVGFSILIFSNFRPTVLFGVLTGMAITIALLSALTLLPKMLLVLKPFPTNPTD